MLIHFNAGQGRTGNKQGNPLVKRGYPAIVTGFSQLQEKTVMLPCLFPVLPCLALQCTSNFAILRKNLFTICEDVHVQKAWKCSNLTWPEVARSGWTWTWPDLNLLKQNLTWPELEVSGQVFFGFPEKTLKYFLFSLKFSLGPHFYKKLFLKRQQESLMFHQVLYEVWLQIDLWWKKLSHFLLKLGEYIFP